MKKFLSIFLVLAMLGGDASANDFSEQERMEASNYDSSNPTSQFV